MKRRAAVAGIVVAAGRSKRMGRLGDKTWIRISDRPVLFYSLKAFRAAGIRRVVIGVRPGSVEGPRRRLRSFSPAKLPDLTVVAGGRQRQDSVWNGLEAVETDTVLVHDAARPAVSPDLISRICRLAIRFGACVPVVPVIDTLKRVRGRRIIRTESREGLYGVQTPQGFQTKVLREAIREARRRGKVVTDCSAAVELLGKPVMATPGDPANIK